MTPTENPDRRVLVSGATGTQGGAVADELLKRGFRVRALTRDPGKPAARALAERGAEVEAGDFDDRTSLERATNGVYGVYSVQNFGDGTDVESRHGMALAGAAAEAGVPHFVYSSVGGAERSTGISFHDSKLKIEDHIRALGLPYTVFRPVFLMRNWGKLRDRIVSGTLHWPLDPDKPHQQIAVRDIGVFVAAAFESPERWLGRETELAGDELTSPQVAEILGRVIGRTVSYCQVPWEQFLDVMNDATGLALDEDFVRMFQWSTTRVSRPTSPHCAVSTRS